MSKTTETKTRIGRPSKTFADQLDDFLEKANEQEVRDALSSIRIWARWKKLPFKIELKEEKTAVKVEDNGAKS